MRTHFINVKREGKFWLIAIPELDGLTQARKWDEIPQMAKEFISLMTQAKTEEIKIIIKNIEINNSPIISNAIAARNTAKKAVEIANHLTKQAVLELRNDGITLSEVGAILGISHQRVSQLAA